MNKTVTALEMGEAWLTFLTDRFRLENGSLGPQVEEQYRALESAGELDKYRELWRNYTNELVDKILYCQEGERAQLLAASDAKSLAYLQDRIQAGTELLTALARQGVKLSLAEGADPLNDYFRQLLWQTETPERTYERGNP